MSRWKASGIHLLLSGLIVGSVLVFMATMWYRWPLFEVAGGGGLTLILAGVDVTLGPLITLIIFRPGKKGLKFDLSAIALVQLAALAYGIHVVYLARPVYLVFAFDRFELVTAKDIDPADLAQVTREEFKRLPLGRPGFIAAQPPRDPKAQMQIILTALQGKDLHLYPQHWVPYAELARAALAKAKPLGVLLQRDPETVQRALRSAGRAPDSVKFLVLRGRSEDAAVLIDAASGAPLEIIRVYPW
jgi:hypothetical protein